MERKGEWTVEFMEEMLEWVKHDADVLAMGLQSGEAPPFARLADYMTTLH